MIAKTTTALFIAGMMAALPSMAAAQSTAPISDTAIPLLYDRGRNTGVLDRARPEFEATGMPAGSFTLYPKVTLGAGATDNIYQSTTGGKSDASLSVDPRLTLQSNWSRRSLTIAGGASLLRYLNTSSKNQNGWDIQISGTQDFGQESSLVLQAHSAQKFESQFSGSTLGDLQTAVPFNDSGASLRTDFHLNSVRLVAQVDFTRYDFGNVVTLGGVTISEANRNRDVFRTSGQAEYAVSRSISLFARTSFEQTTYDAEFSPGVPNRSSNSYRLIAGVSFDLTALMRGSIGLGYIKRDFSSALYTNLSGLSVESKLEWFPSGLTTVSVSARRLIQDSTAQGSSGFFATGGNLRVDHELLRNVLMNASFDYEKDDYKGIQSKADVYRLNGGVNYLVSRTVGISANIAYGKRTNTGVAVGRVFSETSGNLALTVQR